MAVLLFTAEISYSSVDAIAAEVPNDDEYENVQSENETDELELIEESSEVTVTEEPEQEVVSETQQETPTETETQIRTETPTETETQIRTETPSVVESSTAEEHSSETEIQTETGTEGTETVEQTTEEESETVETEHMEEADSENIVTGRITLPENAYLQRVANGYDGNDYISGKLRFYYSNYSYVSTEFKLYEDTSSQDYTVTLPETVTSLTYISLELNKPSTMTSNLIQGCTLYYTGSGWTFNSSEACTKELSGSGNVLDVTLPTSKMYGKIKLPDEAYIEGGALTASMRAKVGSSTYYSDDIYLLESGNGSSDNRYAYYDFDNMPFDAEQVDSLYIYVNSNSNVATNLVWSQNEYYCDGVLKTDSGSATSITLSGEHTDQDFTLRTAALYGEIKLPEDAAVTSSAENKKLNVSVRLKDKKTNYSYSTNVYIPVGASGGRYAFNSTTPDIDNLSEVYVYLNNYGSDTTSRLIYGRYEYYSEQNDTKILTTDSTKKSEIDLTQGRKIDFTLRTSDVYGRIVFPGDTIYTSTSTNDKISGTVYAVTSDESTTYSQSFSISPDSLQSQDGRSYDFTMNNVDSDLTELARVCVRLDNFNTNANVVSNLICYKYEYYVRTSGDEGVVEELTTTKPSTSITLADCADGLTMNLCKTKLHVKLTLDAAAKFEGSDLKGAFYIVNEDDTLSSKYITIPEGEKSVEFYMNESYSDITKAKNIYVYWNSNSDLSANFMLGTKLYYNGTGWTNNQPSEVINIPQDELFELTFKPANTLLKVKLMLPEGSEISGQNLKGKIYASAAASETGSTSTYNTPFTIKAGENETTVQIAFADDRTYVKQLYVNISSNTYVATDLLWDKNLYYTESGLSETSATAGITIANVADCVPVTLLKTTNISGKLQLPENAYYSKDTNGKITVNYSYASGTSTYNTNAVFNFTFKKGTAADAQDDTAVRYCMPVNTNITGINYVKVYVTGDSNNVTNLSTGKDYYFTSDGWSTSSSDAKSVEVTGQDTKLDLTLVKLPSLNGTVTLPEGAFLDKEMSYTVYVNSYNNHSKAVTIDTDTAKTSEYHVILPTDITEISQIYVKVNDNGANTNLYTDGTLYLDENGKLTTDSNQAAAVAVSGMELKKDFTLLKKPSVSGTISLPADAYFRGGDLSGTVTMWNTDGRYERQSFTIQETAEPSEGDGQGSGSAALKRADYRLVMPLDTTGIKYIAVRLNTNSNIETNLQLGREFYCDLAGNWYNSSSDVPVSELTAMESTCNLVLQTTKGASGKIRLAEGAYFRNGDISGKVAYSINDREYDTDFTIADGSTEIDYHLDLPAVVNKIDYIRIRLNGFDGETNLVTYRDLYLGAEGVWYEDRSNVTAISMENANITKDLELEYQRKIKGTITVPNSITFSGSVYGSITAKVNNATYSNDLVVNQHNRELSYEITLPAGARQIDLLTLSFADNGSETNLLMGSCYYNYTTSTWETSYLRGTAIPVESAEYVLDITLREAVVLTGEIRLPSGVSYSGAAVSGYISAYVNGVAYMTYFRMEDDAQTCSYKIQLPVDTTEISKVQLMVYKNSALKTDLLLGTEMYWRDTSWTNIEENALAIPITENKTAKDFYLPVATIVSGTLTVPDASDALSGKIVVLCDNAQYTEDFTTVNGSYQYAIKLPPMEGKEYKMYYELGQEDSDQYVVQKVYVNADGSYAISDETANSDTLKVGIQKRDITVAKWSDLDTGSVLQSSHPYESSADYTMKYTYPGSADAIKLKFSKYTYVENTFDTIRIYGAEDALVGEYTGLQLTDQEVEIPGKEFKIVINADNSHNLYGFGIDKITFVNGTIDGDVATGLVYVNDEAAGVMIHSTAGDLAGYYGSVANYEATGKMIDVNTRKVTTSDGMAYMDLAIERNTEATSGKMILYNKAFRPLCAEQYEEFPRLTISYVSNNIMETVRVEYYVENQIVNAPAINPVRDGYLFNGWYTDEACTTLFEFGKPITENLTLYAGWTKSYAVVLGKLGFGAIQSDQLNDIYSAAGENITLNAVPDEGWKFDHWNISGLASAFPDGTSTSESLTFTMPEAEINITAVFVKKVDVEWISTGIYQDEQELGFYNDSLLVPYGNSSVSLKGRLAIEGQTISKMSYVYSYYAADEDGTESYVTLDPVEIATDAASDTFDIMNLPIGIGTNTLVITAVAGEQSYELPYYLIGMNDGVKFNDDVNAVDINDPEACKEIDDFNTGVVAYWRYESAGVEQTVLIVDKNCEMAKRLELPETDESHIGIGDIWIIPACDLFPSGYSFKIVDFGDAEAAPEPEEGSGNEGEAYSSDSYIYILVEEPDMSEVLSGALSLSTNGFDGVEFAMLPDNAVMECTLTDDDGNEVTAVAGSMTTEGSTDVTRKGFQYGNLVSAIVPKATVTNSKVGVSIEFGDTVIYDRDGQKNTEWDQVSVSGGIQIKDLGAEGVFEYHLWDETGFHILPQQIGVLVDYTQTENFKLSVGGKLGSTGSASEGRAWDLSDMIKDYKKDKGLSVNSVEGSKFGIDYTIKGVDMDGTIILAAVGFDLATVSYAGAGYENLVNASKGFQPILVLMLCLQADGSISAKVGYEYKKTSYNTLGFNAEKEGFQGVNAKIAAQTPAYEQYSGGYHIETFNNSQASATSTAKPVGVHTISAVGKAEIETKFNVGLGLMMCGLTLADLQGGIYAEADAVGSGSIVLEKGKDPIVQLDGRISAGLGLYFGFYARFLADIGFGDAGFDVEYEEKLPLLSYAVSSVDYSGTVYEAPQAIGGRKTALSGVTVTMHTEDYISPDTTVTTDASGKYSFKNLTAGCYTFTFKKDGFTEQVVKKVNISDISMKNKNVVLSPAKYCEVTGKVVAAATNQPVANASVIFGSESDTTKVYHAQTDASGNYVLGEKGNSEKGITPGVYTLTVKAIGYKQSQQKVAVVSGSDDTIVIDTIGLIKGATGSGTITGYIYDIATGETTGIELGVVIRAGLNATTGGVLKTMTLGSDGKYSFTVPVGEYTITVVDPRSGISDEERYNTASFNVTLTAAGGTCSKNGYVSRSSSDDQIRIVLTWGATPSDLDSHLLGPTADGSARFHTYYSNKAYTYRNRKYADLDLDDTTSYGPETTTIYFKNGYGTYSYYVHDYSNRGSVSSSAMGNSGAVVKVYVGSRLEATYRVPVAAGTVWHVFDYDAGTGQIQPVNTMSFMSDPSSVGTQSSDGTGTEAISTEQQDISIIAAELDEKE